LPRTREPEFAAAVDQLIDRLRRAGAGDSAPKPGEPMPGFVLPDENGDRVSLDDLLDEGPVAITFHRGHWCPYCRININTLAQAQKELAKGEGQIIGIMPDLQKFVAELKKQSNVPFSILSDMDNGYALSLNLPAPSGRFQDGAHHDGSPDGRSGPIILSIQSRTAHSAAPSVASDQSNRGSDIGWSSRQTATLLLRNWPSDRSCAHGSHALCRLLLWDSF
jgi:peroxiredoxin